MLLIFMLLIFIFFSKIEAQSEHYHAVSLSNLHGSEVSQSHLLFKLVRSNKTTLALASVRCDVFLQVDRL